MILLIALRSSLLMIIRKLPAYFKDIFFLISKLCAIELLFTDFSHYIDSFSPKKLSK